MKCGINCFQNDASRHKLTNNKKEPYLDIGNGKQWRPAVAKVITCVRILDLEHPKKYTEVD